MKSYIDKANKHILENKDIVNNTYRHKYHLMSEKGWLNDPNGFSIFNNQYHMFYQCHPYSSKWGPMHWGHARSKDLITWIHEPIALAPLEEGPEGGTAFSGSAIVVDNEHFLMYTENWPQLQVQSIAKSLDGIHYERISEKAVLTSIDLPKGAQKQDFRDPKIWMKDNIYYALISSRASDDSGQLLLYKSKNLTDWEYSNTVCKSQKEIGLMWECPDLFKLGDKDILLLSVQYMKTNKDYFNNIHPVICMYGKFDYERSLYDYDKYDELDNGFDFYAPQTLEDKQGRRIMIAWMSMWERNVPTDDLSHNWAGAMTIPRVLELRDNQLIQYPIEELKNYRSHEEKWNITVDKEKSTSIVASVAELIININNIDSSIFGIKLFKGEKEETVLYYDLKDSKLVLDRSLSGYKIKGNSDHEPNASIRKTNVLLNNNSLKLQIFLDKSSIEIFIQDGLKSMTALVYPKENSKGVSLFAVNGSAIFDIQKWDLMR